MGSQVPHQVHRLAAAAPTGRCLLLLALLTAHTATAAPAPSRSRRPVPPPAPPKVQAVNPPYSFFTITPCRVFDSRMPADTPALQTGVARLIQITGNCGIPASAKVVVVNATSTQATADGGIELFAGDAAALGLQLVDFRANKTRAGNGLVRLAGDGSGTLKALLTTSSGSQSSHFVLDLTGYLKEPATAVDDTASLNENAPATAINVLANDSDPSGQPLAIASVTQPANGAVVITGGGSGLTYQPALNYCNTPPGTTLDTFTYTLTAGPSATVTVTVNCVNQPPSFTKGADQSVLENAGPQTVTGWATAISPGPPNESSQTVHFNVTGNTNPSLFSAGPAISPTGTLTYTPATNQSGSATITITLQDDGGTANGGQDTSAPQTFDIAVGAVNQPPSFTKGADQTVLENAGAQTVTGWATSISPGPPSESSQTVHFNVTGNTNPSLFSAGPAISPTGDLTYTPATNQNGSATITITLQDNGGTANGGQDTSPPQTFMITVTAVNQPPSFTKGPDQTVLENAGAQTVPNWATSISPGPPNESGQTVHFNVTGNTNPSLFSAGPAISPTGTLTYTPATDNFGTATITVTLQDNGGTANGGQDTSPPMSFMITVQLVNHAPSFTKGADQTVLENAGAQTVPNWATAISPGPSSESGQTVHFNVTGNTNAALFSAGPAISPTGTLTYTPATNQNGTATITITLQDNGGTANGGQDTSPPQTFMITVTAVNQPPSFTKGPDQTVLENAGAQTVPNWATAISPGPPNESGQTVHFNVTGNTNPSLFSAGPAISPTGTLTYTPATDNFGTATITITLQDNGGTANGGQDTSPSQTFMITVLLVNHAPSFTKGPNQVVNGTAGAQTVPNWATAISPGPPSESGQTVHFNVTSNTAPTLFTVAPAISPTGTLTYTPTTTQSGTATITITLQDNGGTANGGQDTSAPQSFTIQVKQPPVANNDIYPQTVTGNVSINSSLIPYSVTTNDTSVTPFTITAFDSVSANGGSVAMTTSGAGIGQFTYDPPAGFKGTDTFTYTITNTDGSATGTVSVSVAGMFWFINNNAAAGDGRLSHPFNTLAAFQAVNDAAACNPLNTPRCHPATNDNIFIYDSATGYTGPVTLLNSQKLIGQDATSSLAGISGITPASASTPLPSTGGGSPNKVSITSAGNGVTLGSGNTVWGLTLGNTTGTALTGASVGALKIRDCTINTTGAAVSLANGALDAILQAVSSGGGTHGISLTTTTGSFDVEGDGASDPANTTRGRTTAKNGGGTLTLGSGGTIQSATSGGVLLSNATNVTLRNMTIKNNGSGINTGGDGVTATNGSGLTLDNVQVTGHAGNFGLHANGVAGVTLQHAEIASNATSAGVETPHVWDLRFDDCTGTLAALNSTFHNSRENIFGVQNSGTTTLQVTFTNSEARDTTNAAPGNDGISINMLNQSNVSLTVSNSNFVNDFANAVQVTVNNSAGGGSVSVSNSTFNNNNTDVNIAHQGAGKTISYTINNNQMRQTTAGNGNAINIDLGTGSTATSLLQGRITNNLVGSDTVSGSVQGNGIGFSAGGAGTVTTLLDGNTVKKVAGNDAINVTPAQFTGNFNLTLTNNTFAVDATSVNSAYGIDIIAGNDPSDTITMCVNVSANHATGNGSTVGSGFQLAAALGNPTLNLQGYGGSANNTGQIANFLDSTNTVTPSPASVFVTAGTIKAAPSACPTPP
jgi:hypothetical protein